MVAQDGDLPEKQANGYGNSVEGMKAELQNQFSISATPVGVNTPAAPMSPGARLTTAFGYGTELL